MLTHCYRRAFSSAQKKTIFIAAGSPSHDLQAARFMKQIKQSGDSTYEFVGIGGPLMKAEGLAVNFADVNKFLDKPFQPMKNFIRFHVARCYHPYMAAYHYANKQVLNQVDKSTLLDEVVHKNVPSAFITFGNEFFMKKLYVRINDHFASHNIVRPPTFFYDKTHVNQRFEFSDYLDHFFFTIPRAPVNFQGFVFPSTCVGHEGVGRAIQFLFEKSKLYPNAKSLVSKSGVVIAESAETHKEVVGKLVEEQRAVYRAKFGINESKNVFLLAPGNSKTEITFSISLLNSALEELFKKDNLKNASHDNFAIIITADNEANAEIIHTQLAKAKNISSMQTVVTTTEEQKFGAICAADIGVPMNGEIVSECAALQLPSVVISNMGFFNAYLTQLYNNFYADINYAIQGEAYHELVSTAANRLKLSDEIADLFEDPKLRYHFADRYAKVIQDMIPQGSSSASHQAQQLPSIESAQPVTHRSFTYETMASKVLKAAHVYESLDKNIPGFKVASFRKESLLKAAF